MSSRAGDLRYRFSWQHTFSELLSKRWAEQIIPFTLMVVLFLAFLAALPEFGTQDNLFAVSRSLAETGLVTIAISVTLIAGGIDLSVGAVFALTNMTVLVLLKNNGFPVAVAIPIAVALGAVLGAINGVVVAYLKVRPFLATLVSLIVFRGVAELLDLRFSGIVAGATIDDPLWLTLGQGFIAGLPSSLVLLAIIALVMHALLSRTRLGAHITAVGASRKAARHAGIPVERVLFTSYVLSGLLAGVAGVLYAARLESASGAAGLNLEIVALTAAVLGGVSLSGGKGTALRALIGAAIVVVLANGLVLKGVDANVFNATLAAILLLAVGFDAKWAKNKGKALQKIRVDPGMLRLAASPDVSGETSGPWAPNNALAEPEAIGFNLVEGPEDIILDRQGRLYCGDRRGWIWRFSGADLSQSEIFARTGGYPLGMALDEDDSIIVCVGGMGLYRVTQDGKSHKMTDETNRTWWELHDDSRLPLADDCDIAGDGAVYFSEASKRFETEEWILDGMEGRKNGRVIRYDPATGKTKTVLRGLIFSNGVASSHDKRSILVAETWPSRVWRYWVAGPDKGKLELFMDNLPGYTDNINRSSDGAYWIALCGIRAPAYDLAMRKPEFRRRMMKRLPPDEWMYPGMNHGCVVKVSEEGEVISSLWDPTGEHHPTITSMREFDGHLYIAGLHNNRVGRIPLPPNEQNCLCGQMPCAAGSAPASASPRAQAASSTDVFAR
jgi:ribose transport system permease protein